jgi:hypothetical protein
MSRNNNNNATTSSNYNNNASSSPREFSDKVEPKRMDLTLNPLDGSLQVAPLSHVLLAATDSLYNDLLNIIQGELDVAVASSLPQPDEDDPEQQQQAAAAAAAAAASSSDGTPVTTKSERMANLSFAQKRHELAWRLSSNGKSIQHVAGLTAAAASTELARAVQVSTRALQHTRTAWVQADECQDALYFFHAQLFPGRAAPHDIYGAADCLLHGTWYDLPRDLLLPTNRYETSVEATWSRKETDQRWQLSVREKLLMGEVGNAAAQKCQTEGEGFVWHNLSLTGGLLTLTHGTAKPTLRGKNVYPIEALVTVLPAVQDGDDDATSSSNHNWTLLSLSVNVQAKTGEFNHQLEASNRQRFDLHRLAALAMSREERACEKQQQEQQGKAEDAADDDNNNAVTTTTTIVSKPLERLFRVANTFLLSWQLEVLSAQAQSLRRGVWAAAEGTPIAITPVQFADDNKNSGNGRMIISFWKVDDSYGPPTMKCLYGNNTTTKNDNDDGDDDDQGDTYSPMQDLETSSQLRLAICTNTAAKSTAGISLYLSGADASLVDNSSTIVQDLIRAASDPLSLSASDALLAATKLCAELKCRAVVAALTLHDHLPPWIKLIVGKGVIDVAAAVQYHGIAPDRIRLAKLFQIRCDLRTGSFVNTFPRSMMLLRRLAGNEARASEPMAVRLNALPESRRRAAGAQSTGRAVRDVFDALIRSLNQLGHRTGLGSAWDNVSAESASLRARAIHLSCVDVKACLVRCCGATALYGTLPAAIGAAVGMAAVPDL